MNHLSEGPLSWCEKSTETCLSRNEECEESVLEPNVPHKVYALYILSGRAKMHRHDIGRTR